jgi:N-acetylneuraminic acid mutarotase
MLLVAAMVLPIGSARTEVFRMESAGEVRAEERDELAADAPRRDAAPRSVADKYPPLPELVTSFGGAILGDSLYVYGGHTGRAHAYWDEAQARTLRRLDLKTGKAWEELGKGPGLQGLALVAHGGKLYRLGGFLAKNRKGEEQNLWSQADVAQYDPATREWTSLSPLPEPRSSFDAAVLGDKLYVIGGWQMSGDAESHWHTTAYELDLAAKDASWKALPEPPFQRRALSVAAHDGKIYVLGGMQREGGPTTRVDVFDPERQEWSQGPSLHGEPMDGFGSAAFATGGRLYVSTYSGKLQRLSEDGKSWDVIQQLDRARFFHRMLPLSETQLLIVGGASMEIGKFEEVDVIDVR